MELEKAPNMRKCVSKSSYFKTKYFLFIIILKITNFMI